MKRAGLKTERSREYLIGLKFFRAINGAFVRHTN